jgi:aerobic carbon-monoxide dehydrogenase small subunit
MASKIVTFTLNGKETEVMVKPFTTLAKALRERLGLNATKCGCYEGNCGSCTVLVNGEPMLSCILPVEDVEGRDVLTLEGLTPTDGLHPLQQAFHENYAVQCGFCTPGMIMVSKALLDANPRPSRDEIAEALSGNLCRCTGYDPIIAAVQSVAAKSHGVGGGADVHHPASRDNGGSHE